MPDLHAQPRILIVRLGAMGDVLHALPAVAALRKAHPEWYLGWAVEPRWSALLAAPMTHAGTAPDKLDEPGTAMPLVDRIHRVSAKRWARNLHRASTRIEVAAMRHELRTQCYDVAVDLQGAVRSAIIGLWSGAPRRIGEAVPREYPARFLFNERVRTRSTHVIDQACEVISAIAAESLRAVSPSLPYDADAEDWCDTWCEKWCDTHPDERAIAGSGGHGSKRIILMNPGAGWGAKRWPVERYAEVARSLHEIGCAVVVNAGPNEGALAEALIHASGGTAAKLDCTLTQLIAITRRASLMIAGDTGPLHLASALGKPVVAIFGPTDPARNGPYTLRESTGRSADGSTDRPTAGSAEGSNCPNYRVLRSPDSRRDHSRRMEPEAGLLTITPRTVFEAAAALLGSPVAAQEGNAGTVAAGDPSKMIVR